MAATGDGVTEAAVGDRVAWTGVPGSYAQRALVPAERAVPVPDGVDTREELLRRTGELFSWIQQGELDVRIGATYPLQYARRNHSRNSSAASSTLP